MSGKQINWTMVREARENLRRLAEQYPELCCPPSDENRRGWEATLEDVMARTPAMGETKQVAFRLPLELIERLERQVERMRRAAPGITITTADAVRFLLSTGLDQAEHPAPTKGKAKTSRGG